MVLTIDWMRFTLRWAGPNCENFSGKINAASGTLLNTTGN